MSRKLKIVLTISVILNVLLMGLSGGMLYKKYQWHRPVMEAAGLSPEGRNVVARNVQAAQRDMKENFRRSMKARRDVIDLLREEELDDDAYARAVKVLKETQAEMIERKMDMLKEMSRALPPEDRSKISGRFIRPHGPYKRGDRYKDEQEESKP